MISPSHAPGPPFQPLVEHFVLLSTCNSVCSILPPFSPLLKPAVFWPLFPRASETWAHWWLGLSSLASSLFMSFQPSLLPWLERRHPRRLPTRSLSFCPFQVPGGQKSVSLRDSWLMVTPCQRSPASRPSTYKLVRPCTAANLGLKSTESGL